MTLNAGAYMLYDTYEYGMELAEAYAEAVLDDAWVSRIGNKLIEFFKKGVYGDRHVPREGSCSFKELAKAYEALITTGRAAFDSARLLYEGGASRPLGSRGALGNAAGLCHRHSYGEGAADFAALRGRRLSPPRPSFRLTRTTGASGMRAATRRW